MLARSFADENTGDAGQDGGADRSGAAADADYAFDGFRIMFSEKIMLTPVAPVLPAAQSLRGGA